MIVLDKRRPVARLALRGTRGWYWELTRPRPGPTDLMSGMHSEFWEADQVTPAGSERCVCDPFFWETRYFSADDDFDASAFFDG
jgi:hypothetical protein